MKRQTAFHSGVAGVAVGSLVAGAALWLGSQLALVLAVGIVWTAAIALVLHVSQAYPEPGNPGPWSAVIGGSLLSGVALDLSGVGLSSETVAVLTILVIGFTLLGYAAGMATVHGDGYVERPADETAANDH